MVKVKRFKNIWTMGLILFGAILTFFYVAKLFFPEWIIGVAETPRLVEIGAYIDGNIVLKQVVNITIGLIFGYIYCCACNQIPKLDRKGLIIHFVSVGAVALSLMLGFSFYTIINYINIIVTPLLIALIGKRLNYKVIMSTIICFIVDIGAQVLSIQIRDLTQMVHTINTATVLVLCIDAYIWKILLYFYYNEKRRLE